MADATPRKCSLEVDRSFGPWAGSCRGGFDFTLLFEDTILNILPLGLVLILATFRLTHLRQRQKKVVRSNVLLIKLIAWATFAIVQLVIVVIQARFSNYRTRASLPSAVLSLVGSLMLSALSYTEHERCVRPSFILSAYLFFTVIFDSARTRTVWLIRDDNLLAALVTVSMVVKASLLVVESMEKRSILTPLFLKDSPEATSNMFGRSIFWWLNSLLLEGSRKLLSLDDLLPLDRQLYSERLYRKVQAAWSSAANQKSKHSLVGITLAVMKGPLLAGILPRASLIGFSFAQPFLITRAVDLANSPVTDANNNIGYGLIGAYAIVYVGIAISMGQYQHKTYRAVTMIRGSFVTAITAKTLELSVSDARAAAAITLMSTDIERISSGAIHLHEIWANSIEVGIATWLLYRQVGAACAVPLGVAIFATIGAGVISAFVAQSQKAWIEATQKRVATTASTLRIMKGLKLTGLVDFAFSAIEALRVNELRISERFRRLLIWTMAISYITPVLAPILTFTAFALSARYNPNSTLTIAKAFTSLSLLSLLTGPMTSLIISIPSLVSVISCFDRIQDYLTLEPQTDRRLLKEGSCRSLPLPAVSHSQHSSMNEKNSSTVQESNLSRPVSTHTNEIQEYDTYSENDDVIIVEDGSFGWYFGAEPILKFINMRIRRGDLTIICGPVGCGKSTLLKGLLGELPSCDGSIRVSFAEAAYCDQTPWLPNGTIQESIIGCLRLDKPWYQSVIHSCALEQDIGYLSQGDQALVGSNGIILSGGQKQRLALARAVYSRNDVIMLDDILSGLDANTENLVFNRLLGKDGLLRRFSRTVIMTASSVKRLSYADKVIVLSSEGTIKEEGKFEQLHSQQDRALSFALGSPGSKDDLTLGSKSDEHLAMVATSAIDNAEMPDLQIEIASADAARRTGDWAVYKYYLGSVGWLASAIFISMMVAFVFCSTFPSLWLKLWSEYNLVHENGHLGLYLGVYAVLGVFCILSLVIGAWQIFINILTNSGLYFHKILLDTVLGAPMSFLSTTETGVTLNRFSQDLQLIDMELPLALMNTFAAFILCLGQMVFLAISALYIAIAFPFTIIVFYFIQKYYLRTSRQLRFLDLEAKSPLYSVLLEYLSGLPTIRAFGWQEKYQSKAIKVLDVSQKPFYLLFSIQRWLNVTLDLVIAGMAVVLFTIVVTLRTRIGPGYIGVALINIMSFNQSVKLLLNFWVSLETSLGSISRIKNFAATVQSENQPSESHVPPIDWPSTGMVEIHGLSAYYRASEPILRNISMKIEAGEKVAICGRTGSGKSSLILALFRLVEMDTGYITVDNVDICTIPRQLLRSRLIAVPQDPYTLAGSIRLNLDPTKSVTDEAILEALEKVNLCKTIEQRGGLDADMDTLVLSHGQEQLFCFARAMLRTGKVLVLDEPTSSVDAAADALIEKILQNDFKSYTVIVVVHKLESITSYDKVALLDAGRLVEFDSPENLLATPSAFRKLYESSPGPVGNGEEKEQDGNEPGWV